MKNKKCPHSECNSHKITPAGTYFRKGDSHQIHRYRCLTCKRRFSDSTGTLEYRQHNRRVNPLIRKLLVSSVGMNQIARIAEVNYKTVARKLQYLGKKCALENAEILNAHEAKVSVLQFDEMETFEVTKCKPLAMAVAVEKKRKLILGAEVSEMTPKGAIVHRAIRKYGKTRKNERRRGLLLLMEKIKPMLADTVNVISDKCPIYKGVVSEGLQKDGAREIRYKQVKGQRGCETAQGELKKGGYDPLFALNHVFALLRARVSRLVRMTWNTTKIRENLVRHLQVFIYCHNAKMLKIAKY